MVGSLGFMYAKCLIGIAKNMYCDGLSCVGGVCAGVMGLS